MGPASAKRDVLLSMIKAGVNVCRLNFSHGKAEDQHQTKLHGIHPVSVPKEQPISFITAPFVDLRKQAALGYLPTISIKSLKSMNIFWKIFPKKLVKMLIKSRPFGTRV